MLVITTVSPYNYENPGETLSSDTTCAAATNIIIIYNIISNRNTRCFGASVSPTKKKVGPRPVVTGARQRYYYIHIILIYIYECVRVCAYVLYGHVHLHFTATVDRRYV